MQEKFPETNKWWLVNIYLSLKSSSSFKEIPITFLIIMKPLSSLQETDKQIIDLWNKK